MGEIADSQKAAGGLEFGAVYHSLGGMMENIVAYPQWTEVRKKTGLDPLGMLNSSVGLYQTLLPGISNVTLRMRYYGLYPWLAERYAKDIGNTDPNVWKRYIRRTEALFALTAARRGGEFGVAGIDWAQGVLSSHEGGAINFARAADPGSEEHYLRQAWGAFGGAYRSQLLETGILDRSEIHEIPLPGKPLGQRLAKAFRDSLGDIGELCFDLIRKGAVTLEELDRLAPVLPSSLVPGSEEERCYRDVLLPGGAGRTATEASRNNTIRLILSLAAMSGRAPRPDEVRWALYAGYDSEGRPLELAHPELEEQRRRWRIYQANDLCHVAHAALLKFTLDTLGSYPAGVSMARLVGECAGAILAEFDDTPQSWSALLEKIKPVRNAFDRSDPDSEIALADDVIRAGRNDARACPPATAAKAVRLLAVLYRRMAEAVGELQLLFGGLNPDGFRSLLSEMRFIERYRDEPFRRGLERVLEERIIRRHLWVALRKLRYQRDYTFLIEADEGKLRLRAMDGPVFTTPRLGAAITFMKDIHLVGGNGLTDDDRKALGA